MHITRRSFSRFAAGACAAPLSTLVGCGGGSADSAAPEAADERRIALGARSSIGAVPAPSVCRWHATPNPTGLRVGFWEVFKRQGVTLATMGRRPSARVGFDKWGAIEPTAGADYVWPEGDPYGETHRHGETVLASVNVSYEVPAGYTWDDTRPAILDPTVRAAALKFLKAYVRRMLRHSGSVVLTIDYEIVYNWKLYEQGSQERAGIWADWYIEAAAAAREAAAAVGLPDALKLQPIVNGNPFDEDSPISKGRDGNPWLVRVMAVSDSLALDTYYRDPQRPADPTFTIDVIDFWRQHFSDGKPVVVAEHGFSTIDSDGEIGDKPDDRKFHGTREQQALYFDRLFAMLLEANRPEGRFKNQLRGFHIWSITDNMITDKAHSRYYGLHESGPGAAPKPAAAKVLAAIRRIEGDQLTDGDPLHRPCNRSQSDPGNLAQQLRDGTQPVDLLFTEGDDFEFLRYTDTGPADDGGAAELKLTLATAGTVLACVNGQWLISEQAKHCSIDISAHYAWNGGANVIDVCVTGPSFPVRQQVNSLRVAYPTN